MKQKHLIIGTIITVLIIVGIVLVVNQGRVPVQSDRKTTDTTQPDRETEPQTSQEITIITDLNTPFQIQINQIAFIENENLKIKFLNVTEDSRCPSNVLCVWEGQATVVVNILKNDQNLGDYSLTSRAGLHEDLAIIIFDGYSIKLIKVEPYPKTTQGIETSDYIITLIISKL